MRRGEVPQEDGVIGRQLTLALIYGTGWTPHAESLPALKRGLSKVLFDS